MSSPNHNLVAGGPHYYTLRPDSNVGGEVYERALLQRLPRYGVDVVIGAPRGNCAATLGDGVRVDTLDHDLGLHWAAAPAVFVPYVVGLLRRREVDLLRGHSVRYCGPALLLARRAVRSRVPVVLHHHHLTPRWRRLELALLRQADGVVTVSEFSRRELVDAGVTPARIHVIANGVQRPSDAGGAAPAWPSASGLRLLYLGRLEARKRPSVALDALVSLHRRGVDASLVVAGAGDGHSELVARAQSAGVSDRVAFLGQVSEEHKWLLYEHADILLFPSALEGFGLVVAEAQASGLPAVAAHGTAASEALDPGCSGVLAAPTGDAFADAIMTELGSSDRRAAFGQHARSYAARFDWDRAAAATASLYRELVYAAQTNAAPLRYRYLPPAVPPLHRFERNVTSQCGEDGVIEHCLEVIGDRTRWCVEFGAADGRHASNTHALIRDHGYAAVLIERDPRLFADLQRAYADRSDVVVLNEAVAWQGSSRLDAILARTPIPEEFDLLVIDIDGNDYHVWNAVEHYRPKLVVIEFNGTIPNEIEFVQAPDMDVSQGSSFMALVQLADVKGYRPVHATAVNAFFVRSDCYPRFGLGDVDAKSLRSDLSLVTWLFQTYDGRLTVTGNQRVKSHDVPIRTARLQQVPRGLRAFPPSYSPLQRVAWRAWHASRQPRAFLAQHTPLAFKRRRGRAG